MSHVRGIVKIIKENNGKISISQLAEEAEEDVDDLLPLLEASKLLGFIVITKSDAKITPKGEKLASGAYTRTIIRESLTKIEPFKSTIKALSEGSKTTVELFEYLSANSVFPQDGEHSSESLLKMLLTWGVRSKLLSYDQETETWTLIS
ncbi:MAG TPA: AAA-associated domain-containing protein [Candidatus Saccharimonadales bacterium]|nr:AAA-associated domain-containing protein [Candidatus Saccharimonadales bacterium]